MKPMLVFTVLAGILLVAPSVPAQSQAATLDTGVCIPLPPDAAWNQYVNFRPISNEVVNFNPPIFSWCYVPGFPSTGANDNQEYNFVLQVANDNAFTTPVINVTTPCNFYNFLPPLQNTNGTIYWRVGYVSVVNNTTNGWITNSFQISGTATNWDRSMLANPGYLSGRASHPYMGLNVTNRAAINNWLSTNQLRWVNVSWAACQTTAASTWTQPWYTGWATTNPFNSFLNSGNLVDVAFMWQMTRNPYWTNQNPTPMTVLTNLANWYITNYLDQADDVNYDPTPELWVNFAYCYDWLYDAMDAGQRNVFITAFHDRALFMHSAIGWWRKANGFSADSSELVSNRVYAGPYSVFYPSDAKNGNTHAHQNFETDFPMFLAAYGDDSEVSNVWYLGANYILSLGILDGHDGGVSQGRGYNISENFGPGSQALFTWNNAANLAAAFPEAQVALSPVYHKTARFMDMETPVNFYELNDPWGDGVGNTYRNWFHFLNARWAGFGIMAALSGDGNVQYHLLADQAINYIDTGSYVPYNFFVPYYFPPPAPTTNNILGQVWPEDGYVIGLSSPANQSACYASGVGFIFAARPRGAVDSYSTGHSTENDLDFQIWAYGANVTDSGDSYACSFAHCSWSRYSPTINGIGQYQNPDEQTHPWYSRILAFTNAPDYVYCAADGTDAYPIDQRYAEDLSGAAPRNLLIEVNPTNVLSGLTSVTRQILFEHRKYFVIYDSFIATSNFTYSIPYQIMEPTLAHQSGASFTYTCSNQITGGNNVTVYVSQIVNPALLSVTNMTGTNATGASVKTDPITGDNEMNDFSGIYNNNGMYPRSCAIWTSNLRPTTNFHFMTVIYPVPPGGTAPVIQRIDDYTVSVTAGAQTDVISFDPNTTNATTFLVNSPAIIATGNPDFTFYPTGTTTTSANGSGIGVASPTPSGPPNSPRNLRVIVPWTTNLLSAFTPVPGYFAWWNPDTLSGSNNNITVPTWVDNSSANLIASQPVASMQPNVEVQAQNVHNYLWLNGYTDWQYTNSILSQPCEIFIAAEAASTNALGYNILLGDNSYEGNLAIGTYNGQYCIYSSAPATGGLLGTNWQVITAILNGANSQLFVNGAPVINCSINGAAAMNGVCIGSFDNGGNGQSWVGAIGDVVIYTNILSSASQQIVENGIRAKYGF